MSGRYEVGEFVDITIRGARISRRDSTDRIWFTIGPRDAEGWVPCWDRSESDVIVERRWPAYGQPKAGEVWENPHGLQVFVYADGDYTTLVSSTGSRWDNAEYALDAVGPLRRVYPPVDEPAAPVEDQADEPVVEQRTADLRSAALLRAIDEGIRDGLRAPYSITLGANDDVASVHLWNDREAVDVWAARIDPRAVPAVVQQLVAPRQQPFWHYQAEVGLPGGGRAVFWVGAEKPADEPAVDGSPSDLDTPILDAAGALACGCLGTDTEHSCRDGAAEGDEPDMPCANDWHFGADRPRLGPCPACGEPAPIDLPDVVDELPDYMPGFGCACSPPVHARGISRCRYAGEEPSDEEVNGRLAASAPAEPETTARVRPVLSAVPEQRRPCGSCDAGLPMACTCADPSDADGGDGS